MSKIVIITGLTNSGKSSLALDIAKAHNGEIISADSVQIYRGLDIGSAKESVENRAIIPHHLIDILDFKSNFNVGDFLSLCNEAIQDILSRGKNPIIVGGTGLYIKALMDGYSLGNTPKHDDFRTSCLELATSNGNKFLWDKLYELNPRRAEEVHFNNVKRVIRYLEIEKFRDGEEKKINILDGHDVLCVGIIEDRATIYARIDERVDNMLKAGLEKEVRHLFSLGATSDCQSMNSIGYKEWFDYFDNKADYEETVSKIKQHSRNYCKRQLTFLKTINNIELTTITQARNLIEQFYKD